MVVVWDFQDFGVQLSNMSIILLGTCAYGHCWYSEWLVCQGVSIYERYSTISFSKVVSFRWPTLWRGQGRGVYSVAGGIWQCPSGKSCVCVTVRWYCCIFWRSWVYSGETVVVSDFGVISTRLKKRCSRQWSTRKTCDSVKSQRHSRQHVYKEGMYGVTLHVKLS